MLLESNKFERHYLWQVRMLDQYLSNSGSSSMHMDFGNIGVVTSALLEG